MKSLAFVLAIGLAPLVSPRSVSAVLVEEASPTAQVTAGFSGHLAFHQKGGELVYDLNIAQGRVTGTQYFGDPAKPVAQVVGGWYDEEQGTLSALIQVGEVSEEKWRVQAQQFFINTAKKTVTLAHALYGFGLTEANTSIMTQHVLDALEPASKIGSKEKARALPGWGEATDPDQDCKFAIVDSSLLIRVPGGDKPHDLAAEIEVTNAPRVLQAVQGDFTMQVQVDGRFAPGGESTLPGRVGYNGAGLVAVLDDRNVVTLARAVLQRGSSEGEPYANFEIRVNGDLQRIGSTGDHSIPKDGPAYLRLERRGDKMLGGVSADGVTWDMLEAKDLPAAWPRELRAGVIAISTSPEEFRPRFSKLQLGK